MSLIAAAEGAANRAKQSSDQQATRADQLAAEMSQKVSQMQAKENLLNSSAYAQALAIFQQTGHYPTPELTGDSLGEQALRFAEEKLGDPYVWGGAGPDDFDCSGLVMDAYASAGVDIARTSQAQWASERHVSAPQPGDLVFYPGADGTWASPGHVALVVGHGQMIEAYATGYPIRQVPIRPGAVGYTQPWGGAR